MVPSRPRSSPPGAVTNPKLATGAVNSASVLDNSLTAADIGTSAIGGTEVANGALTGDDIQAHSIGMGDLDGTDHYGALGIGGISNGRCTTVTVSTGGSSAGDAVIVTTDGTLPDGEVIYGQRVLDDTVHVKVCNLSGGDLPPVTVNVRIITFH